jgi:hydroxymethylbilane synthase
VTSRTLRLGTRGSRLALWQASHVARQLTAAAPGLHVELVTYQTLGDRVADVALPRIGDRGLFTQDIESGLRAGAIDLAVHSLKDLPTASPPDLAIGAVLEREDPRDALVSASGAPLRDLPSGARVGTSSLRRRVQLLALRGDLDVADIRGNVPTRLDKVSRGDYDATLLAQAGLLRLGLADRAAQVFGDESILPAPGQGALAVQIRTDDEDVRRLVTPLGHRPTQLATLSERAVLASLRGGCQAPLGTMARWTAGVLRLAAVVGSVDGRRIVRAAAEGPTDDDDAARALGERVARGLLERGADALLTAARDWLASAAPASGTA